MSDASAATCAVHDGVEIAIQAIRENARLDKNRHGGEYRDDDGGRLCTFDEGIPPGCDEGRMAEFDRPALVASGDAVSDNSPDRRCFPDPEAKMIVMMRYDRTGHGWDW